MNNERGKGWSLRQELWVGKIGIMIEWNILVGGLVGKVG